MQAGGKRAARSPSGFSDRLLDGLASSFFGADTDTLFEGCHKYLAITNLAVTVFGALEDGLDCGLDEFLIAGDVQANLAEKGRGNLLPPIEIYLFRPPPSGAAANRNSIDLSLDEFFANLVQLVGLDNRCH